MRPSFSATRLLVLCVISCSNLQAQVHIFSDSCDRKVLSYEAATNESETWMYQLQPPNGDGRLYYFGALHLTDTAHPQFMEMERAWQTFRPTIAFFEGPDRGVDTSGAQTISNLGESGYVRYLAKKDDIPVRPLEDRAGEYRYLVSVFGKEKVQLFYILSEAARLRSRKGMNQAEITAAINKLLPRMQQLLLQDDTSGGDLLSIAAIEAAYNHYWQQGQWWEAPTQWFDPMTTSDKTGGIFTNEINRASSQWRNMHMYRLLSDAVLRGERVFAVVGRNHVPLQIPAIKCRLGIRD